MGRRPFDVLHLSSAVEAEADMFCTTDDQLLQRGSEAKTTHTSAHTGRAHRRDRVMNAEIEPLDELNDEALQLLMKELGVAKTARFLQQFTTGSGDLHRRPEGPAGGLDA